MSQIDEPKLAFALLRPFCVQLTRDPTLPNVRQLNAQLRLVTDAALQQLQAYVLFPLRFVLRASRHKGREDLVQAVSEGITYVLSSTCVQSWDLLRELFSELCLCICSPGDPGKPAVASEELKEAVLHGIDVLLHATYGDILFSLYEPVMLPGVGAAVSLFLALAKQDKSRKVQAMALKCLLTLMLTCDCSEEHVPVDPDHCYTLGDAFACFLPGITQATVQVITGDIKQGHMVLVRALRVWYKSVSLTMDDQQLSHPRAREEPAVELGKLRDLMVRRTPEWAKDVSGKLAVLLKTIISCTSGNQHWKVRLELVKLSEHLLSTCHQSFGECVGSLLDALIGMVNDDSPAVRDQCTAALERIALENQTSGRHTFTDVLSENLHGLATSLPRLMRTSDDRRKLFHLNVFLGYLKILGPQVAVVLNSAAHLQRISRALVQVLELDVTDVRIVEQRNPLVPMCGATESQETHVPRKHFVYFTDEKIFALLQKVCQLLGYYGNLYLLVDHFMDIYRESTAYRKQCSMVLNEIVTGAAGVGMHERQPHEAVSQDELKAVVTSIIEEYTSLDNWDLVTHSEEQDNGREDLLTQVGMLSINSVDHGHQHFPQLHNPRKGPTIGELNSNIWQICIQLQGIGSFAKALGMDFQLFLITTLYPILEKAGDEMLPISQSALAVMWDICRACGYGSLKELINLNSDYLLNDVSLNLQRLSLHPHSPRVLAVMFCHSDSSLLPLVRDAVQDVLTTLDQSYDERALLFCVVLHSLLKALVRWFPAKPADKKLPWTKTGNGGKDTLDVRQFLLEYSKLKRQAEGQWDDEDDKHDTEVLPTATDHETKEDERTDAKSALPLHISLAKDVMERCIHLLSQPSLNLRLKVLDMLELCIQVLLGHENVLLPLSHHCWPALLHRLTKDDPLAVLRAFGVLCTLGEACGDFLRQRVSKDVLPQLTASLLRQAPVSARAGPVYTHTLAYKLQLAVLEGLGALCLRLDFADTDLDSVSEACLPYLSCRQPVRLQEASLSVFRHLIQVDPDAIWFILSEMYCPHTYNPPHPEFLPPRLTGMGREKSELTDNILQLLGEIG